MASAEETAGGVLAGAMWSYAALVLEPARAAKRRFAGPPDPAVAAMAERRGPGLGPLFSQRYHEPQLLDRPTEHDHLVEEFDRLAEAYDAYVRPFSTPIFAEALRVLEPLLTPDARVLDAGCGPGRELRSVARVVVDGEVVGVDLAAGMVVSAYRGARASGLDNTAFVQSDVGELPAEFEGTFDLAYNCLAHHHYPEPEAAAAGIFRSLRPGGTYAIVDPGPAWFVAMSAALSKAADPGWVGFHTPEQFESLLVGQGFVDFRWVSLLPGFGLAIGCKPL